MVIWRFCSLLNSKQAVTILLWYVTCHFVYNSVFTSAPYFLESAVKPWPVILIFGSVIVLYSVLGVLADAFIGRYRLLQFSLWVQWITAIVSTLIISMSDSEYYHMYDKIWSSVFLILSVIEILGLSSFQVVAIQFGTDQLQGAPSQLLSAFVFWYFMTEILLVALTEWISFFLSFSENKTLIARIHLAWSLFNAISLSAVLCIKSYLMSEWFSKESTTLNHGLKGSNPYSLIFHVLKFAKEHKCPVHRSALTYWEAEIPSRINLGKRKYGGPFANEEVEDVKTFLQLLKLLLCLSGILIASFLVQIGELNVSPTNAPKSSYFLIISLCKTATAGFLTLCHLLFPCFSYKYHLSILKRIGIGSVLTIGCVLCILLINCLEYTISVDERYINIITYLNFIIPMVTSDISYIVLTVSLLEFIIAQSPHSMKGILIGFFYAIRYGMAGLVALIQQLPCTHLHSAISCSGTVNYAVITFVALLSFIMFSVVSCKYKLRERDEVVNVHIFAEEYYGTRGDDSSSEYSNVD